MNQNRTTNELELYKSFYDAYPDAILVLEEGVIVKCNRAAQQLFYTNKKEDLLGKKLDAFTEKEFQENREEAAKTLEYYFDVCTAKGNVSFDWKIKNKDKKIIETQIIFTKIELEKENFIQAIIKDDTEQKQIQKDYQSVVEELRAGEEELKQNVEELEAQRDYIQEINTEIKEKSDISERNSQALLELSKNNDIYTGNLNLAFEVITKTVAKTLHIERVGIWRYAATKIICQKQYEKTEDGYVFSQGEEVHQKDTPTYFADLVTEKNIVADFAQNHPALVEFVDSYLIPLQINSMLDIPYFIDGKFAGVICCETQGQYKNWTLEDIAFVKGITDSVTIAIKTHQQVEEQEKVRQKLEELEATHEKLREKQVLLEETKIALEKQNSKMSANEAVLKKTFYKMKAQEEEVRQSMEELQSTQEAMREKQVLIEEAKLALEKQNEKLAANEAVLKKAFQKMKTQDAKLRESYDALQAQEEELRQNMEELQTTQEVLAYQKDILEISNRQITKSISYAQTIQKAILPSKTLINEVLPESFVIYKPKDIVSGDFYWVSKHENKTLVGVIDCTGHGVPGAFMSLVGSNILSEIINQKGILEPNLILQELHEGVVKKLNQKEGANNDGMDLTLCLLEEKSNKQIQLTFGGVKQNLYIVRNQELIELKGNRRSIGGGKRDEKRDYKQEEIILQKNDAVFLATDGYADQANEERMSFSKKSFRELMLEVAELSANEQKKILEYRLAQHQKVTEQRDDITVFGFKI